jgi:hypothetical protein
MPPTGRPLSASGDFLPPDAAVLMAPLAGWAPATTGRLAPAPPQPPAFRQDQHAGGFQEPEPGPEPEQKPEPERRPMGWAALQAGEAVQGWLAGCGDRLCGGIGRRKPWMAKQTPPGRRGSWCGGGHRMPSHPAGAHDGLGHGSRSAGGEAGMAEDRVERSNAGQHWAAGSSRPAFLDAISEQRRPAQRLGMVATCSTPSGAIVADGVATPSIRQHQDQAHRDGRPSDAGCRGFAQLRLSSSGESRTKDAQAADQQ